MKNHFCSLTGLMSFLCADARVVSGDKSVGFYCCRGCAFLKYRLFSKSTVMLILSILGSCLSVTAQAPKITSFSPASVCQGNAITITGTDFTGATAVKIGNVAVTSFTVTSSTTITATVPYQASTGTISVTTSNGTDVSATPLTVLPAPIPSLTDLSVLNKPFTNCDGNSTYRLDVQNTSTQVASQSNYDIDWGDNSSHFAQTDWPANAQISHTYTSQGYFTIKLTITPQNGCTKSVTYNFYNGKNPIASFTTTTPTTGLCAPALITFKIGNWFNNSTGTTYRIDYGDGSAPVVLTHPLNNTNTDQLQPYTYLTSSCPKADFTATLNAINGCFTTTYTLNQIVISTKPTADFSIQPSPACVNDAVCFTNKTISGYNAATCNTSTTYLWDFGDGSAMSSQASPPCHSYSAAGPYTVTLTASNLSCGNDVITKTITVNPISPIPSITSSPISYCQGQPAVPLTATGSGLFWYTSATGGTGSATAPTPSTSNTGTYTYYVSQTLTGNCESPRVAITVIINATPKLPVVITPVQLCQGDAASPLTALGNALLWYATINGGTGSSTAPTPLTTDIGQTTYYVSQTTNGCESGRASILVNVNPVPTFTATAINPTQCGASNGSIQLAALSANTTYTINYTQNGTAKSTTLKSDGSGVINISNLPAGIYDHLQVTGAGCPSAEQGPFTLSSPNPPATPTLSSNGPICSGGALQLNASTTTTGAATWNWSGPNGFTNSSQNPVITNVPAAASGTYQAAVTINGCTSVAGTLPVQINPSPATPILSSNSPVCSGSTLTFSNTSGGTGVTYNWTGPNSFSSTVQNPSISNVTTTASGVYQVEVTLGSCTANGSATVTVNELPQIGNTSFADPTQCATATGSIALQGLQASKTYIVNYTKNGNPVSTSITADNNGILRISGLTSGTYDQVSVSLNNCVSAAKGPFVLSDPTPPATPTLSSNGPICSGNALQLTSTTTSPGTAAWNWTGPNGYTSTDQNPTLSNTETDASGTYYATVTINNCKSAAGNTTVIINPTPAVPNIVVNTPVCSGGDIIFSNLQGESGSAYSWTGPNGYTSTEQAPVIAGATTANGGTYIVTATLGSCSSKASKEVTVNETPVITEITSANPTQCATTTGAITLKGVLPSKSYTVTYTKNGSPVSIILSSDGIGNVIITGLTAGTYDAVAVSLSGCVSNTKGPVTLSDPNPPPAPTVSSNGPLCAGSVLNLTAQSGENGTFTWSGPNGFSSSDVTPTITGVTAANAGTYNVTITVNNCISPAGSVAVVVNPLAPAPVATSPVEYCINSTASTLTATATNGSTLNWYTVASGGTDLPDAPVPATSTAGSVFYYVAQTTTEGCEGARTAVEVVTHPDAKALFSPSQTLGCSPFVLNSSVVNLQTFPDNNKEYLWYANDASLGAGDTFPGYTVGSDDDSVNIKLVAVSKFGCRNDSIAQNFFTYQLPKTAFINNSTGGCGPLSILFTNKTPQASLFRFKWIFGNGQTSEEENPPPITFPTNPTYGDTTYHVTLLGYTVCDTITAATDILIKSKPKSLFAPDATNGCSPLTVNFSNISKGFGTGYQWFFGDGAKATSTDASPVTHTYNTGIQDTFYAKMVATNECGTDTSIIAIVVSPNKVKLDVFVNGNQSTGCAPHTVQFINRSSGASTFAWNFGDGNTLNTNKNIDTVTHTYTQSGTYTTNLFASNGCSDTTTTEKVTVFAKPVADFSATPLSVCIGDTIAFQNQAMDYSSLSWQFGDNTGSVLSDPQHAYTAPGNYTTLQIAQKQYENGTVCADTSTTNITVVSKLPGNFTVNATNGICVPFTVTFTNQTLPSAFTSWTFGDGGTATGDVVTHTFATPGNYTVFMQAKHPAGCLYEATTNITVKAPAGTIAYASGFVCNNTPVRFESNTTNTDSVRWDFGDGTAITTKQQVVYHVFDKSGTFIPTAELISGTGCHVPAATSEVIKVDYLQAGFAQQQDVICGKTTVHFNDTSRSFFGISNWKWNLGDGTETAQQNPVRDYTASGTLPTQLVITGNSGCTDTSVLSLSIKVNDIPVATITGPTATCDVIPVPYISSVSAVDAISQYQWTITGGAFYNTNSIVHTFAKSGGYTVQLIAGTAYGCYDTTAIPVVVSTTPTVMASNDITICRNASTPLSVNGTASQYNWQTDNTLSCTACQTPLAAPVSTTQYYVTGKAANGCTRTDSVLVTVVQPFTLSVTASDSICIGQSKQLTVSGAHEYTWSPANTLDDSFSQYPVATPLASTTYSVIGTDDHHCFTDTKMVRVGVGQYPTVNLGKDTLLSTGSILPLHTEITNGPIKTYAWSPADNLSCSTCPVPDANIKRNVCYSVTATSYYGCAARDTLCIKVFCESGQVFIPNIFTPDGDGVNDRLIVQGKGVALIRSFRIFNRWGQVVFEKTGFQPNDASSGWDGRINGGAMASQDVYVYTCDVVCEDGTVYPLKGNVAIVK